MPSPDRQDPYAQLPELYDLEHDLVTDDLVFYQRVVVAGPVLEIGAGTGRVMQPLLESGLEVWGIDPSVPMIERARARLTGYPQARLVVASLPGLHLQRQFATCLFPLNTLCHITTPEEQVSALQTAADHLESGGLLVIDSTNPLTLADRGSHGELRERFRLQKVGRSVTCDSSSWDSELEQTVTLHLRYDSLNDSGVISRIESELFLRYVYASELCLMLRIAGFRRYSLFGSYDEDDYGADSPNLIAVAIRD